jgi:phospholipase/carboxylesterase
MITSFHHQFIPSGNPPPAACLLLLHGTGGNEWDLLELGHSLDRTAALLSPRGKVAEAGGVTRFFKRHAEGVFDLEDLSARANELADWVNEAARTYGIDRGRITAVGYSNGANIASAMMLLRPEILSSAILLRPMVPFVPEQLPDLSMTRVLIAAGRHDTIAGPEHAHRLADMLSRADANVLVHWSQDGHALDEGDIQAARNWLMHPALNAG